MEQLEILNQNNSRDLNHYHVDDDDGDRNNNDAVLIART
jgi:hypothetical protein